jgi:holo-[acyl-carrier protein] synthase
MSIIGIGLDITSIPRIARSLELYQERFLHRVFHPEEIAFSQKRRNNAEFLAACFAVKEAALKALSDFPGRGISWAEIYITHEPTGKPVLHFEGKAKELFDEKGAKYAHVSITHDQDLAMAQVILET